MKIGELLKETTSEFSVGEWKPLSSYPAYNKKDSVLQGIYQLANKEFITSIDDNIVHKDIGYTGMSENLLGRLGPVRTGGDNHGAGVYLSFHGKIEETYCRLITFDNAFETADIASLEKDIHEKTKKKFGYKTGFKWSGASSGVEGKETYILKLFKDIVDNRGLDEGRRVLGEMKSEFIKICQQV